MHGISTNTYRWIHTHNEPPIEYEPRGPTERLLLNSIFLSFLKYISFIIYLKFVGRYVIQCEYIDKPMIASFEC